MYLFAETPAPGGGRTCSDHTRTLPLFVIPTMFVLQHKAIAVACVYAAEIAILAIFAYMLSERSERALVRHNRSIKNSAPRIAWCAIFCIHGRLLKRVSLTPASSGTKPQSGSSR
jgi:hypothetical protein